MPVTPNSIITPQAVRSGTAKPTTANSTYTDTPTNTVKLVTAGANGARLTRIDAIPLANVTATQLQLFRSTDGGTTKKFFSSKLMAAYTMSQVTAAPITDFGYSDLNPLILASNEEIYAAIGVTGAVCFEAEWGDF